MSFSPMMSFLWIRLIRPMGRDLGSLLGGLEIYLSSCLMLDFIPAPPQPSQARYKTSNRLIISIGDHKSPTLRVSMLSFVSRMKFGPYNSRQVFLIGLWQMAFKRFLIRWTTKRILNSVWPSSGSRERREADGSIYACELPFGKFSSNRLDQLQCTLEQVSMWCPLLFW